MKETDDDKSDGNRNGMMTTMMRTKRMKRMMKMMGMMRIMKMLKLKMKMVIMMSKAVVGFQNLFSSASESPPTQPMQ